MAQPTEKNIVVGSKRFTESYILGEILNLTLRDAGVQALHRQGLGNTAIVVQALITKQIDVYPEYTGTILREILKRPETQVSLSELNTWLKPQGLKVAIPLGFNNTYALAMRADKAKALGLKSISDIANLTTEQQSMLRITLSPEFKTRSDGWPTLVQTYNLKVNSGKVLEHGLAYDALARGDADIVDAYSTDAAIARKGLILLEDDRQAFPRYDAILLMRSDFNEQLLEGLVGKLNESTMTKLNGLAESGVSFEKVAQGFLDSSMDNPSDQTQISKFFKLLFGPDFFIALRTHVLLVVISSTMALLVGVPLGILAHRRSRYTNWILGGVGILQTIPSLALLTILIRPGSLPIRAARAACLARGMTSTATAPAPAPAASWRPTSFLAQAQAQPLPCPAAAGASCGACRAASPAPPPPAPCLAPWTLAAWLHLPPTRAPPQ
jgi:osmoprotectant transport system permease protein